MKLAVGADHAGLDMKSQIIPWLQQAGHEVVDVGAHTLDPADDFPDFAAAVGQTLCGGGAERGVMICGSGVGATIASNKVSGVRAALCHDTYTARQGVEHNDMNVLCLGGRVIGIETSQGSDFRLRWRKLYRRGAFPPPHRQGRQDRTGQKFIACSKTSDCLLGGLPELPFHPHPNPLPEGSGDI